MSKTYEALNKKEDQFSSKMLFLDLKSKKQSGDLEKKISQLRQKKNFRVFNFTSSRGQEGVSSVIANLAQYMTSQKTDKKILFIDANFHHPNLHNIFRTSLGQGLTDVLEGAVSLDDAISQLDPPNLSTLFCGKDFNRLRDNINQEKLEVLLHEAKEQYDYILIDSAPILSSPDAVTVATAADTTLLVIESFKVQKEVAQKTKNILLENECHIGGVVLNRIKQVIPEWVYKFI